MRTREIDDKLCFVLMPFHEPFNTYYHDIIKPAVSDADLYPQRADEIYSVHPFMTDVWENIWKARVVLAELTSRNPNVMYELGLCHAVDVPTVLLAQTEEDIPSDFRHVRCIIYDPGKSGKLRQDITKMLWAVLADDNAGLLLPDAGQRELTFKKRFEDMSANQRRLYRFILDTYKSTPVALTAIVTKLNDPDFRFKDGKVNDDEAYYRLMTIVHLELLEVIPDRQWTKSKFRIPRRMFRLLQEHRKEWLVD
jgi:hypothetical protein